jgi:hypothetical protein
MMRRFLSALLILLLAVSAFPQGDADLLLAETFDLYFTTRQFSSGAPFALAGSPVISAYEDDSVTQITAGITLDVNFDSVTGLNHVRVVATGANGYEAGKSYSLVITTGTVDSVSVVGEVVGSFTLERSAAFERLGAPAGASVSADVAAVKSDTAAILTDTGTTLDDLVDDLETRLGTPSDFGSGTSTIAANLQDMADNGTAVFDRSTDSLQAIRDRGDAAWTTGAGTGLTPLASGTAQAGTASTIQLSAGTSFADDILNGAVVKVLTGTGAGQARLISDYTGATDTATITPNWTTNPSSDSVYEVVEGHAFVAALAADVITSASVATDALGIDELHDDVITDASEIRSAVGLASANLDSQLAAIDNFVDTEVGDILNSVVVASGTADSGSTTTMVDAARTEADTDYWTDAAILFTSGTISGQSRLITDFNAATDTITFSPAVTQAVSTNTYEILPNVAAAGASAPSAAENADAVWDELVADHVGAGSTGERLERLDIIASGGSGGLTNARAVLLDNLDAAVTSRLAPTTAGRTLDVTATGEAGVDLDNTAGTLAKTTDITGFNDLSAAAVNTEVDTAIVDARLDELLVADSDIDGAAPPTVGSVWFEALTKTAGSFTYDQTTDSPEAIRDNMGTAQTGDSFARLGAPAGASVSADVAAVKSDTAAILVDTAEIGAAGAGLTGIPMGDLTKNAALSNFLFLMIDDDHITPATGLTVTGQISCDAAAFAGVSGTIAEVGSGVYQFDALAADTNCNIFTWKFSATGADTRYFTFRTKQ